MMTEKTELIVVKKIASFLVGFISIFTFYIQFHGKVSPGGGFQSGVAITMIFIIFDLINILTQTKHSAKQIINMFFVKSLIISGVLIYLFTGLFSILFNGLMFEYSKLSSEYINGNIVGIFGIETGVGLAVGGSMMLIYLSIKNHIVQE